MNTAAHHNHMIRQRLVAGEHWMSEHHAWALLVAGALLVIAFALALIGAGNGGPAPTTGPYTPYGPFPIYP